MPNGNNGGVHGPTRFTVAAWAEVMNGIGSTLAVLRSSKSERCRARRRLGCAQGAC